MSDELNQTELNIPTNITNDELLDNILAKGQGLMPWETCRLPSLGLYYGWADGDIKVKPMGITAEKALANQRIAQSGETMEYLFRECCRFPDNFDPSSLLIGDRTFLLYYLRGITHGNNYEFLITCPNCKNVDSHNYDLSELAHTIKFANPSLGKEPFKVILPYLSEKLGRDIWVNVRFLRGIDALDVAQKQKLKNKMNKTTVRNRNLNNNSNNEVDNTLSENMEKVIVDVLGSSDPFKKAAFIEQLHARDTATIREWLKENSPGIDNTIQVTCSNCEFEANVELPITESFFRPTDTRRIRK